MTMNHTKLFLKFSICLCFALFPSTGAARTAKAIFLGANQDSPQKAYLLTATKSVEIELPRRYLSPVVELPDGELTLVVSSQASLPEAPHDPPLPQVKIPESCKHAILIFRRNPENKAFPVRVVVIDASSKKLPLGHTLLFNLSGGEVAAKFGDKEVFVKPNKSKLVSPPNVSAANPIFQTTFVIRYKGDSEWRVISRATQRHYPNIRQLLFAVKVPGRKYPRIWGVVDSPAKSGADSEGGR